MQLNSYAVLLVASGLVSATLGAYAGRRRQVAGATAFVLLMLALTAWSLAYGFELASTDLTTMKWAIRVQYPGIAILPVLWFILAVQYTGRQDWLSRRKVAALFIVPVITVALVWSNDLHHLYYASVGVETVGQMALQALTPGPWYLVNVAYSYLALLAGTVLILGMIMRSPRPYRW